MRSLLSGTSGFSFIELLVVIAIIAVLSTIGMVSYQSVAKSGRDGKRKGDLSQIRAAMELYRSQNGFYPASGGGTNATTAINTLKNAAYLSEPVPADPKASTPYQYNTTGNPVSSYYLCATVEGSNSGNSSSTTSITGSGTYYCVTQP